MKQTAIVAFAVLFLCLNSEAQKTKNKDAAMAQAGLPYTATYSSQFAMGNPAHTKMILELYHDFETNDFSKASRLADTVMVTMPDGQVFKGRDAAITAFKQQRAGLASTTFVISAVFPVRSVDRNTDWVCVWGSQQFTTADNSTQGSMEFQSIWNINKDGQVSFIEFFEGKTPAQQ